MARDPYSVLGVPRGATDDEIKKAYRKLSRMYHPDANINNPDKEHAEQMFKEVQQAYQQIMDDRENGGYGSYGAGGSYGYGYGRSASYDNSSYEDDDTRHMKAVFNYINNRRYTEACNLLNSIHERNGQWYYYSAIANSGAGNNVTAMDHINMACQMEPYNTEYQNFKNRLENGGGWYAQRTGTYGFPSSEGMGMCGNICFYYCLCNMCLGGRGMCL